MTAFRAPLYRKFVGILAGTLLLLAINQLRVVALFFVGVIFPAFITRCTLRFSRRCLSFWPWRFGPGGRNGP